MKAVKEQGDQGDIRFVRVKRLPEGATQAEHATEVIVGHSETGHHHVAIGAITAIYMLQAQMYLVASGAVDIEHRRDWDTHETLRLLPDNEEEQAVWKVIRQREWSPDGWRQVAD